MLLLSNYLIGEKYFTPKNLNKYIENKGQWDTEVLFSHQTNGLNLWLTKKGIVYDLFKDEYVKSSIKKKNSEPFTDYEILRNGQVFEFNFLGNNEAVTITKNKKSDTYYNYFIGNDSSKWANYVGLFEEITINDLYDGIDMRWYFNSGYPRYDFVVHPQSDYSKIKMKLKGVENITINGNDLVINTRFGPFIHKELSTYQIINGNKHSVKSKWLIRDGIIEFKVENYNPEYDLIIDPLIYSTFIGGSMLEFGTKIKIDPSENAYITGGTFSGNFPTTIGCYSNVYNGGNRDVIVTKLNQSGTGLIFSTFLGGSDLETGFSLDFDTSGNIVITGNTASTNFPVTAGVVGNTYSGGNLDAFVTKLNQTGSGLIFSSYIGGSADDGGRGVKLDNNNNIYITGFTYSGNFPVTPGSFSGSNSGQSDGFVVKLNSNATSFIFSTYLGGSADDMSMDIIIDNNGKSYVTGETESSDFPVMNGCYDLTYNGGNGDAFVTVLNNLGSNLFFSTYLGGSGDDIGNCIVLNDSGFVYVTGNSNSPNFPTTPGVYDSTFNGGTSDIFVSKLDKTGSNLLLSTYIGGNNFDEGHQILVNSDDNIFITGFSSSWDFPTTPGCFDNSQAFSDITVCVLDNQAGFLLYSSFLGGINSDFSYGSTMDIKGNLYITGQTSSSDYPVTPGCFDNSHNGFSDALVTKFCPYNAPTFSYNPSQGSQIQTVCMNSSITPIQYNATNFGNIIAFGLPPGVSLTVVSGSLLVQGVPTQTGTFYYGFQVFDYCQNLFPVSGGGTLNVLPIPNISAASSTICSGQQTTLSASGANTYTWNTGHNSASIIVSPSVTTTYSVYGSGSNGCVNFQTVHVFVNQGPTLTINQPNICLGDSAVITASGAISYTWNNGSNSHSISVSPSSTAVYILNAMDANGCMSSKVTTVTVYPLPQVTITGPTSVCAGVNANLIANGAASYTWSNGSNGSTLTVNENDSATFSVTGTDANGCSDTASFHLLVDPCVFVKEYNMSFPIISLYPNPSHGFINLENNSNELINASVLDCAGRHVFYLRILPGINGINVSELQSGIYFLRLRESNQVIKFVIY